MVLDSNEVLSVNKCNCKKEKEKKAGMEKRSCDKLNPKATENNVSKTWKLSDENSTSNF